MILTRHGHVAALLFAAAAVVVGAQSTPAPALAFPDEQGTEQSLAAWRGQVVLVDVWASWCGPCKVAFHRYDSLFTEYRDRGFRVLAINVDEKRADADRFLKDRPHQMAVVFDPKGVAPERLRLTGMPTSYLVDRRGSIRYRHEGFAERDLIEYRRQIEALLAEAP